MLTEREISLDAILQCRKPRLLEPRDLALRKRLTRELRKRRPAPEPQRLTQHCTRAPRIARRQPATTLAEQRPEPIGIDLALLGSQHVTAAAGDYHPIAERLTKIRHVHLHRLGRAPRRTLRPQLVDQTLGGNDLVGVHEQDRQHRPLLEPPQRERATPIVNHLKRSEHTKAHLSINSSHKLAIKR